jgi:hypothetical protein
MVDNKDRISDLKLIGYINKIIPFLLSLLRFLLHEFSQPREKTLIVSFFNNNLTYNLTWSQSYPRKIPYILAYKSRNFGPFWADIFSIRLICG